MAETDQQQKDPYAWVKKLPLTEQVGYFQSMLEKRTARVEELERQIEDLQRPPEETAAEKAERLREEKERRRRGREERAAETAATELRRARAAAIRALAKLLPEAVNQARAKPPRPALLRLILRATR
jgi:hypothetical protein